MNELNSFQKQILETPELESTFAENLIPIPFNPPVSGLYQWRKKIVFPQPIPGPSSPSIPVMEPEALFPFLREELRLDVDRHYPQMVVSGTIHRSISSRTHWIANLTVNGQNSWTGTIWYKDGDVASFPYTMWIFKSPAAGLPISAAPLQLSLEVEVPIEYVPSSSNLHISTLWILNSTLPKVKQRRLVLKQARF